MSETCPRCSVELKPGAKSCECGWKKRERASEKPKDAPRIPIDCAYAGCAQDATIRLLRPTGWANVCKGHYWMLTLADAKAYTASLGLKTREDMINFCRARIGYIVRKKERVPGEDDEERAA